MRHGLQGDDRRRARGLALREPTDQRVVPNGEVRGFNERPTQVLVPILGVAGPSFGVKSCNPTMSSAAGIVVLWFAPKRQASGSGIDFRHQLSKVIAR
jgi:hypothetical protein